MSRLELMGYGGAHVLQGLALIFTWGAWNPIFAHDYALRSARRHFVEKEEVK